MGEFAPRVKISLAMGANAPIVETAMTDERFDDERNTHTQAEIDEAEAEVSRVDELRYAFREFARTAARELHAIGLLDPRGIANCDSAAEVIEAAAEEADEIFAKLLWTGRFEQVKKIAGGDE